MRRGGEGCVTSKTSGAFNLLNVFKLSATESHFAVTWQNKALFEVADPWLMQCPTSPVCVNHEEGRRDQTNLAGWQTVSGAQSRFLRTTGHPPSAGCHLRKERHRRRDVKDSNVYTQKKRTSSLTLCYRQHRTSKCKIKVCKKPDGLYQSDISLSCDITQQLPVRSW